MSELIHYDTAKKALALARTTDEVKKIRSNAAAMREYARQAKDKDLEIDAAEIRIRAERRLGELIREQKRTVGLARPAVGSKVIGSKREPMKDTRPTLAEAGIDKKLSMRSQKLAAIPENKFEKNLEEWREETKHKGERITLRLIRNGSSSHTKSDHAEEEETSFNSSKALTEITHLLRNTVARWPDEVDIRPLLEELQRAISKIQKRTD